MKHFTRINTLVLFLLCLFVNTVHASTITALWDFQNMNPSSLSGIKIEGTETHVASSNSSINMFVIAKSGKFAVRTSDVQMNANTYLRIPVQSTKDVITIVSYPGYHNYTINGTAATANTTTHTATASEVTQGYVQVQATSTTYLYSIKLVQTVSNTTTATWDFQNVNPSALSGLTIEGTSGHIPSTLSDVNIYCIGAYGKFAQRTSDAQVNAKTTLRIPVTSTSDVVTVTSYPGYHNYALGGTAVSSDKVTHTATATEVSQGYVVLYTSATSYLYSIQVAMQNYTGSGTATSSTSSNSSSSSSSTGSTDNTTTASGNFTAVSQEYYVVTAGSASSFLSALSKANSSTSSSRKYIFLPNGTYDLGTTCLTAITGSNISIIGQSMKGTIIKNTPAVANEGISTTATILNKGNNNYFQDLTLKNALDYYNAGSAGRAVALQDKGTGTICKNVCLDSYQDTYYSNNTNGQYYFEGSTIYGTVDFICGSGDAFFNNCTLGVRKRTSNGSGSCVIAAPYTSTSWGYVFNNCTISNAAASYSLGRAWGGSPKLAYINTVLTAPTKILSTRFTAAGMNVVANKFVEYNSKNTSGTTVSPSSNIVSFTYGSTTNKMETILSDSKAAGYALSKVFTNWTPNEDAAQLTVSKVSQSGSKISWSAVSGASSYAIFKDDKYVAIVGSGTTSYTISATGTYTVRASNPMGGFGTAASVKVTSISSSSTSGSSTTTSGMSSYDQNAPIGWATYGGSVTGSSDKNTVTVTTADELVSALAGTSATTIYVKGTLTFTGQLTVNGAKNKTVYGLPGSALSNPTHTSTVSKTGILFLKNCSNIILRNLTFKGAGAYDIDGNDNLTLQNCQYIWVDHCDFQDGVDGNFDANNGSNNIAVTWCRFRYLITPWAGGSGGSDKHCFSNLWGGSDKNASKDEGKLNTTFANCWWDEGCIERMPRVRFGKIHIVNCLYSSSVASYCIGAAYKSNIYVENTAFTSSKAQKNPWANKATSSGYTDYNITLTGCSGATNTQSRSGSNSYFNPSSYYSYSAYDVSKVESQVSTYAGATLSISVNAKSNLLNATITAINSVEGDAKATTVEYYNANGIKSNNLQPGLNIIRTTHSDGTITIKKVMQ